MFVSGVSDKKQVLSGDADRRSKAPHTDSAVRNLYRKNTPGQAQSAKGPIKANAEWTTEQKALFTAIRWLVILLSLAAIICICIFAPHFAAFTVLIFGVLAFSAAPDFIKMKMAYETKKAPAGAPRLDIRKEKASEIKANNLIHSSNTVVFNPDIEQTNKILKAADNMPNIDDEKFQKAMNNLERSATASRGRPYNQVSLINFNDPSFQQLVKGRSSRKNII